MISTPSSELSALKPRDSTLKREQNSRYEHDNGLKSFCISGITAPSPEQKPEALSQSHVMAARAPGGRFGTQGPSREDGPVIAVPTLTPVYCTGSTRYS